MNDNTVTVIGLGSMGSALARALLGHGWRTAADQCSSFTMRSQWQI